MLLNIRRRNRASATPELIGTLTAAADAMLAGETAIAVPMDPLRCQSSGSVQMARTPSTAGTDRSMPWHIPTFLSYEERERSPPSDDEDADYRWQRSTVSSTS